MNKVKFEDNHDAIKHLANQLVVNHLRVDLERKDWNSVLKDGFDAQRLSRTIAIVGAGASTAANLPVASQAVRKLRNKLKISPEDYKREISRLEFQYDFAQAEFETALLAFNQIVYPPDRVRNSLRQLYDIKFQPLLVYEILAHMLKHRFLDAIINFNFDELLDQSIADELTPKEYHYIVHDGDCPEASGSTERPYELPVYLKPHGTISHRSSMRFTKEAYYGIPREIRRVLQGLLSGAPITLLVIGFSMGSSVFNKILDQSQNPIDIFYVNTNSLEREFKSHNIHKYFIRVKRTGSKDLGNTMRELWNTVANRFISPYYAPRGIDRHELVSKIFAKPNLSVEETQSSPDYIENYLHDRTLVELAMSIAKAKGLVNMSVVSHDRCGKYYDLYRESDPRKPISLHRMYESLNLEEIGYAREAYRLKEYDKPGEVENKEGTNPNQSEDFWIIGEKPFEKQAEKLFKNVQRQLSIQNQSAMKSGKKFFISTLMYLYRNKEIELLGKAEPVYNKVFKGPRPVRTLSGLSYETEYILQMQKWDKFFVIAETGEWLLSPRIVELLNDKKDLTIYLIVTDRSFEEKLGEEFGTNLVEIRQLNWWDHNQHITLTVEDRTPQNAIYFTRRLRSPNISPIVLSGSDSQVALEVFIAYWLKAKKSSSWIGRDQLSSKDFFDSLEPHQ